MCSSPNFSSSVACALAQLLPPCTKVICVINVIKVIKILKPPCSHWIPLSPEHLVNEQQQQNVEVRLVDGGGDDLLKGRSGSGRSRVEDGEHVVEVGKSRPRTGRSCFQDGEHVVEIRKTRGHVDAGGGEEGEHVLQIRKIREKEGKCFVSRRSVGLDGERLLLLRGEKES